MDPEPGGGVTRWLRTSLLAGAVLALLLAVLLMFDGFDTPSASESTPEGTDTTAQ